MVNLNVHTKPLYPFHAKKHAVDNKKEKQLEAKTEIFH